MTCACPVCGGVAANWYRFDEFGVYACSACGLVFRWPLPSAAELEEMYESEALHASVYFSNTGAGYSEDSPEIAIYRRALARLEDLVRGGRGTRRLLDAGAGPGVFLDLARAAGWEVSGVELSRRHVLRAHEQLGIRIECGDFLQLELADGEFDVVTMWDFLEHVTDPRAVLGRARRLLRPGGILFVFTIDSESLFNRLADLVWRLSLGRVRRPLELLYDARHNYYFPATALRRLLEGHGLYKIVAEETERAHLGRWLSQPAPPAVRLGARVVDAAAVVVGSPYRRAFYCAA